MSVSPRTKAAGLDQMWDTAHVLAVMRGLVTEHAAPNRSVLIEVVLDAHLHKLST